MKKSMCFFDIDNTLVPFGESDLREAELKVLDTLKANGHYVFINTGRTKAIVADYLLNYDFDGYVFGCGTQIEFKGELVFDSRIDPETAKSLMKDIKAYKLEATLEGRDYVTFWADHHPTATHILNNYLKFGYRVESFDEEHINITKFCVFMNDDSDIEGFIKKYEDKFDFIYREDIEVPFYEVAPKGCSKGEAIKFMANKLGIDIEDCYAFGDSGNDIAMLTVVKHSIGMGNSSQAVKDVVEFISHDCKDDGIEFACRHYGLI